MAYCQECGKEFGDIFTMASLCSDCRRNKLHREESERLQNEREARLEREEERRHRERLAADSERLFQQEELEKDRRLEEEMREFDADQRRREHEDELAARAADLESERESFLERQRDELANRWKYEAQSKLSEAEALYKAGALNDALKLATDATALGMRAFRLLGWIHRDRRDVGRYAEQLGLQIGLLSVKKPTANQNRVLEEVISLGGAGQDLLKAYFSRAAKWTFFPYAIHDVLAARAMLGFEPYRALLSEHIDRAALEREDLRDAQYGKKFLNLIVGLDRNNDLMDRYVAAIKKKGRFPSEVIHWLLELKQLERAKELFNVGTKLVKEDASDELYLWKLCPLGMELAERGAQPRDWEKKFRAVLKTVPFDKINFSTLREAQAATWLSPNVGKTIRTALGEKGAQALRSEKANMYKQFRKEKAKPEGLPVHQRPELFAAFFTACVALLMWVTGAPAGFIAGVAVAVFFASRALKRFTNVRLFADVRLAEWESKRRESIARMAALTDDERNEALGIASRPSYTAQLIKDAIIMTVILATTFGAVLYWTLSDLKKRGVAADGSDWTRDWEAYSPTTKTRLVSLLSVSDAGSPTMTFYERGVVGGALRAKPVSLARLTGCIGTPLTVSCNAVSTVIGNPKYASVPAKLDLNLADASGRFTLFPRGEPTLTVELKETPRSLTEAPAWVQRR